MGVETFLILVGLIGDAATDEGTKANNAFDTALTVGLVMLGVEIVFVLLFIIAGGIFASKRNRF